MKCCICKNNTELHILYDIPIYKCYKCNGYYIKDTIIDTFILKYANDKIKYKSNKHKIIFSKIITLSNKAHKYVPDDIKCNYGCRDNCNFYKFKYLMFDFRYCNFINKYYIEIDKLEQYIYKTYKKSLIYYYKEIIFNGIKKLFVKG